MDMYFTREDWKLFRNIDTLAQKSGVGQWKIPRLVAKELTDNALDVSDKVEVYEKNGYLVIWNDGEGIEVEKLAELFSINRPLVSSKLLRLPTRGALGNGLRVVMGAIIATGGRLFVSTKGNKFEIIPQSNGNSEKVRVAEYTGIGTKVEINLGDEYIDTTWADTAVKFNKGETYKGKTSAYWYSSEVLYELCQSTTGTVHELVQQFDGCTGTKAGKIAKEFDKNTLAFDKNTLAKELTFNDIEKLLGTMRSYSKPVKANRLGVIGVSEEYPYYYRQEGIFNMKTLRGKYEAEIPFNVEVFMKKIENTSCSVLINKTPAIESIYVSNIGSIYGMGLSISIPELKGNAGIVININTPYMPISSDGKTPNLEHMEDTIKIAVSKAVKRFNKDCKVIVPPPVIKKKFQKDVVIENLDVAVEKASGGGKYLFSLRQLFYVMRPIVAKELGEDLQYGNFNDIITKYEANCKDVEGLYRDNRGSLYTPHLGGSMAVGTRTVKEYVRPPYKFNKILYFEKEGFFEMLIDSNFPERYDCALLTSKGYASRAVKDLIDLIVEDEEEIQVFCVHDCDKAGTMIYQTLQEKTKARGERKIRIIDLGLNPKEAISMGLEFENVENDKGSSADYLSKEEKEWLETHRVELNAMPPPLFMAWLEGKMNEHGIIGKIIPPKDVILEKLENEVNTKVESEIESKILQKILEESNYEEQVEEQLKNISDKLEPIIEAIMTDIDKKIESRLSNNREKLWKEHVDDIAGEIVKKYLQDKSIDDVAEENEQDEL